MAEITVKVTTTEYGVSFYAEASPISYDEYGRNVKISIGIMSSEGSGITTSGKTYYIGNDTYAGENTYNGLKKGTKYSYFVKAFIRSPYVVFAEKDGEFTPWRENKHLVGKEAYSLDYDNAKNSYTKVRIVIDENADPYEYGTDVGRTLEIKNPWVAYPPESEEARDRTIHAYADDVAQDILTRVNGYSYQPFDAKGAFLSDDAELGDAVWFDGVYGAIVSQDITFDGLGNSDVSAPNGEDNENEFGEYVPSGDSSTEAQIARLRTSFIVQYGLIQSTIESLDEDLSSQIEQRLDSISLSVSSSNGTTSFVLKDGETTLDTKTLNLTVDHANISGKLTANQIDATNLHVSAANVDGDLRAGALYGGTVVLYDTEYSQGDYVDTPRGSFDLTGTEVGIGVAVNSLTGLKLNAVTNVSVVAGSGGELTLRDSHLIFSSTGIRLSTHCFGNTFPTDADYGELYFQLVT